MSETPLISLRGLVYFLDQAREWQPQGDGYSQVSLYHDTARDSYRVVAMSLKTKEASINSRIFKEQVLKKDNDTFYQWADAKNRYGVNFAEEDKAAEFERHFREIVEKLSSAPAPTQTPAPVGSPSGIKRAPSFGGGGSTIGRGTAPPQFNPTARGPPPTAPTRQVGPPRPFQRPQPPGRTTSNNNLTSSGGVPTLSTPPPLVRGNSTSPISNPPPAQDESQQPPSPQSPPEAAPAPETPKEEEPPKKVPPVVSPRAPRVGLSNSNTSTPTSPTTTTTPPAASPRPFTPGVAGVGSATVRRATPPLAPSRGDSQRNVTADFNAKEEERPEPVISAVSTMDLGVVEEETATPTRSKEVDTILSPKGEIALRRKQVIDMTPELKASVLLISVMMKEHSSLFDNRTEQVSAEVKCMVEFLEAQALETKEIFAYRVISKHLLAPLLKSMRRKGAPHLPTDTDPHLVAEMLKISYEELPRRPFHFEKFEPEHSFNDLTDHNSRVQFVKKALTTVGDAEKQSLGILISLLVKTAAKSKDNGMDGETLAALFAPFLVDGKWLNHKIPPAIKLKKPFKI